MILNVNGERLFDVSREIAQRTLVHAAAHVVLEVSVQIPLVRCAEFAQIALDHRHRVVLDVFRVPGLDVRDVIAFDATKEFLLQMSHTFVSLQGETRSGGEITRSTFQIASAR